MSKQRGAKRGHARPQTAQQHESQQWSGGSSSPELGYSGYEAFEYRIGCRSNSQRSASGLRGEEIDPSLPLDQLLTVLSYELASAPTPAPPEDWLVVFAPTTAYSLEDEPLRTVEAGAWYHLVGQEANWAMAVAESDPPEDLVWIQLDSRVQVTSG